MEGEAGCRVVGVVWMGGENHSSIASAVEMLMLIV